MIRRIRLELAPGLRVEFTDRDRGIQQVLEFAEKSTWYPVVVFGPEGCGKTAWLKQSVEILKEQDFSIIYFNPMRREFLAEVGVKSVEERVLEILKQASSMHALAEFIGSVIDFAREAIRFGRRRIAIIVDDAFQFTGVREASFIVKGMLEIIEYPPESYERIVAIAATSEGLSRWEIGRHRWALLRPMWNMGRRGFEELYEKIPGPKPSIDEAWRLTGGNPDMLTRLYQANWNADIVVTELTKMKRLTRDFVRRWGIYLGSIIEDPDKLWEEEVPEEFINELVTRNFVLYDMYDRDLWFWIDEPPPVKNLELGIGKHTAWQTPLHREAVKRALREYSNTKS